MFLFSSLQDSLLITLMILAIIVLALLVVVAFYGIASVRRLSITLKKVDILVEDISYKSAMLDPTFNLISKVTSHLDALEAFSKNKIPGYLRALYNNQGKVFELINVFRSKSKIYQDELKTKKNTKVRNVNVAKDKTDKVSEPIKPQVKVSQTTKQVKTTKVKGKE